MVISDLSSDDAFRINHTVPFGVWPGAGICGAVLDAAKEILVAEGIGPIVKWVDDFGFLRFPSDPNDSTPSSLTRSTHRFAVPDVDVNPHTPLGIALSALPTLINFPASAFRELSYTYAYTIPDIISTTEPLGLPWAISKWIQFQWVAVYIGVTWDLWNKRVYISDLKRVKYHKRVVDILARVANDGRILLAPLMTVHGCLMHITFVMRLGRSRLPSLQRAIQGYTDNFRPRKLSSGAQSDLIWWRDQLASPGAYYSLHDRGQAVDRRIFVDASKKWGIGLRVDDAYMAWKWKDGALGTGGRDIGGAESIAIEFVLHYLQAIGIRNELVLVRADNKGSNAAHDKGRGRNMWSNAAIQRGWEIGHNTGLELDIQYIASADNPADQVSRGDFTGLHKLECAFPIPAELHPFLSKFN